MNILENILKQFIDLPENLSEVTNKRIIEVDDYLPLNSATNLVVGHVLTCIDHPNSDHLHITTVNVGDEVLQIVCGAPNVAAGQYVIVSKIGAVLPGDFQIKKGMVRGVESNGMICSLKELGFDEKHIPEKYQSGIFVFEDEVTPGQNALAALGLDGNKLVLGMTANRGDLLSHLGFAHDLGAMLNLPVYIPQTTYTPVHKHEHLHVEIKNDTCYDYNAAVLEVKIKESPWWLKNALIQSDIRPINNVVDITNYILITYGTPLHAFDFNKVNSDKIVVRNAKDGEKVVTLDEVERTLVDTDIVITDGKNPIALGGVMGLANSSIDDNTTKIILEAALFAPSAIQKTSRRLGLRSDSSLRYERGVERERVMLGMEQAIQLLVDLADAEVYEGMDDAHIDAPENPIITLNVSKINRELGLNLTKEEIISLLERLNYSIEDGKDLKVQAPGYRYDINIHADVVEEIARVYGYDEIPLTPLPVTNKGGLTVAQKNLRKLRHTLAELGLNEVINYSLIDQKSIEAFPKFGEVTGVLTPMSEDRKYLRQSLLGGLLQNISYHGKRQIENIFVFEMGHVFAKNDERNHVGVALSGKFQELSFTKSSLAVDFFVLKGLLDKVLSRFGLVPELKKNAEISGFHPGIAADILVDGQKVGVIGKIHPSVAKDYDLEDVFAFEFDLSLISKVNEKLSYETVSRFPSITRDISFVISKEYAVGDVLKLIKQTARKLITDVELFDVYQGKNVEDGHQSLAVSITFNNKEKTLETEEVEKALKSIKNRLGFEFKVKMRD